MSLHDSILHRQRRHWTTSCFSIGSDTIAKSLRVLMCGGTSGLGQRIAFAGSRSLAAVLLLLLLLVARQGIFCGATEVADFAKVRRSQILWGDEGRRFCDAKRIADSEAAISLGERAWILHMSSIHGLQWPCFAFTGRKSRSAPHKSRSIERRYLNGWWNLCEFTGNRRSPRRICSMPHYGRNTAKALSTQAAFYFFGRLAKV